MFIGDGYRSLLLSDVSNNYPYFKTTLNIWKFQYSVWYSMFKDIYSPTGIATNSLNRYGTFHYLSYNVAPGFNMSFFETVIFEGTNSTHSRGFDPNYLNPVIFYRPVEYSMGSPDNELLGFNTSYKFLEMFKLYGQVVLDEFNLPEIKARRGWWGNKQGFQLGLKHIDAFGIKNLSVQGEFNWVRPYTYSHASEQQNYSNYNQPLAHPLGANFYELLGFVSYKYKRMQFDLKGMYAIIGKDTSAAHGNIGQNIFLSYDTRNAEYGNYVGQGVKTNFMQGEIKFTYFIIPGLNLRLELGYIQRHLQNTLGYSKDMPYIYLGIKTSMYNLYRDF
jgi:hypothetical protein